MCYREVSLRAGSHIGVGVSFEYTVKLQDYPILSGWKRCGVEFQIGKYKVHVQSLKQIRARPQCMCCATCHLCALDFGQRG